MYDDYMSIFKRKGQVALVVILVVLVGLTVGVAILGRSVTNVGISNQEEERARSFSAAEAGVEDALRQDLSILAGSGGNFNIGDSSVSYKVSKLTNVTSEINPGEVVTVDWSKSGASSFSVTWSGATCTSNLVATAITSDGAVVHSVPSSPATFSKGPGGLVRMRFAGCRTNVTINGTGGDLSFFQVDSVGTSGEANSRVEVVRSAPAASGLLDFAVFSGGDIN
jgi:Tfp pilus assembly protein PilX